MTVGETLTASSLGSAAGGTSVAEPVNDSRQKPATEVNQPMVVVGGSGAGGGPSVNVVTAKIGQELVTSLHLIKDIRRLEKYQRDFFLKVSNTYMILLHRFCQVCKLTNKYILSN